MTINIFCLTDQFAMQAGFKPGSLLCNDEVAINIERYKKNITQSYASAQQLIVLLDDLIAYYHDNITMYSSHRGG